MGHMVLASGAVLKAAASGLADVDRQMCREQRS
jgi:hypothetical protein